MASIHLLGGKKKLLTIQVADLVHLQTLALWARLLKKNVRSTAAVLTSLGLLLFLFAHFHGVLNSGRVLQGDAGTYYEGGPVWTPSQSCQDCFLSKPVELGLLESYLLLVLVHAKADDRTRRDAIRQTWVSDYRGLLNPPVQYRFVVGGSGLGLDLVNQLLSEAERFGDMIILDDVSDSQQSLTSRTLDGFSYALDNFQFKYILKCDDDSFVDLPRVVTELQHRQYHARFYWGYMTGHNQPHFYGQYAEKEWALCDRYLPYAMGGGYIISRDLAELLRRNRAYLEKYSCEDVSVGVWLAPYNIERRHDTRFNTEARSRGCKSVFIVSHKVSPTDMYQMYESLQLDGTFCAGKTQWYSYDGFIYNWTAPSNNCCKRRYGIP